MKWGFLTVLLMGLSLLLGAPFVKILAPSENLTLSIFDPETQMYTIVAKGADTLWYQWQSWSYIFVFCIATSCVLGLVYYAAQRVTNELLIEAKEKFIQKTQVLEQLKREYRNKVEQDVLREHDRKTEQLNHRERELYTIQNQSEARDIESQKRLKLARNETNRQYQQTQSKLGQRDRLREEKKCIAEFLDYMNWNLDDGSKLTYSKLKKLAKERKH